MTQTPVTSEADAEALARLSTDRLMLDLLRRGNAALSANRAGDAERLFRAVLAWRPGDPAILQVLGEIALAANDWNAAREHTLQALAAAMEGHLFIRTAAIHCSALYMMRGAKAVAPAFAHLRPKLVQAADAAGQTLTPSDLNLIITCAMCAGDHAFAHQYFLRRYGGVLPPDVVTRISPSAGLREWCTTHGAAFEVLEPVVHVTSKGLPPIHGEWSFDTAGVNIAVIPGGMMHSGLDFVFAPDGVMLNDSGHILSSTGTAWYPRVQADPTDLVLHLWSHEIREVDAPALFMSCAQGWHTGHFIVDFLPRLRALTSRPNLKVAIPSETPQKHRDLLALFGVGPDRIIDCDLNHTYRFRELVVVQNGNAHRPDPNNICFVTDHLRTSPQPAAARSRLYLERDIRNRTVVNQDEFYAELDRLGFIRISLTTMSVAEQRAALSAAEVVVSTYGSDLLAFYMMNEGAALIELNWNPQVLDSHANATCSMVGVRYYLLPCAPAAQASNRLYKKDNDFIVGLAAFRATLRTAGIAIPD